MKSLLALLALTTLCRAQTPILSETFASGALPSGWSSRFGYITTDPIGTNNALAFHNRSTSTDVFTAPLDLSARANYSLTFNFLTAATDTQNLLIGLSDDSHTVQWLAGSPAAATFLPLAITFSGDGSGAWQTETIDLTPFLTGYTSLQLTGMEIAIESRLNGVLSADPVYLTDIVVIDPVASPIPESASWATIIGMLALVVCGYKRRTVS